MHSGNKGISHGNLSHLFGIQSALSTLRLLMSYIYMELLVKPEMLTSYIYKDLCLATLKQSLSICCTMFQH